MSLQYIFPDHTARNRHIAIAVEISAAVIALVLMIWAGVHYWSVPEEVVVVEAPVSFEAERKAWLEQPNTGTALLQEEIDARKEFLIQQNPSEKLTSEQVQARKSWLENI